jgi:hypothetical protein
MTAGIGAVSFPFLQAGRADENVPRAVIDRNEILQPREGKTDKELLQGTWTLVETHKHGKKVLAKDIPIKPHQLAFEGGNAVLLHTDANITPRTVGTFELD